MFCQTLKIDFDYPDWRPFFSIFLKTIKDMDRQWSLNNVIENFLLFALNTEIPQNTWKGFEIHIHSGN